MPDDINPFDVSSFTFRSGSAFFRLYTVYKLDFDTRVLTRYDESATLPVSNKSKAVLSLEELALLEEKIMQLHCETWKENYFNIRVKDGHQWRIELTDRTGQTRAFYGSNAYPDNWKDVADLIDRMNRNLPEKK